MCAKQIASNFEELQKLPQLHDLPSKSLLSIMDELLLLVKSEKALISHLKAALSTRSGRALAHTEFSSPDMTMRTTHKFFCDEIDCRGHVIVKRINRAMGYGHYMGASASGTYRCSEGQWEQQTNDQQASDFQNKTLLLPPFLQNVLAAGVEEVSSDGNFA